MSSRYEELLKFLSALINEPCEILNSDMQVFKSEFLLYGEVNHRLQDKYIPVRNALYENCDSDESLLFPLVSAITTAMHTKLQQYMKDYLYHNPNPCVHSVLSKLQPHNDRCERVFGSNDWLNKILPNIAQSTRSTMVEFSLYNTMKWLKERGEQHKEALMTLAQESSTIRREDAKYVFERKLEQRIKVIKFAQTKIKEKEKRYKPFNLIT